MSDESGPGFLRELQRRRVYRVTAVYLVIAWLLIQAADTILPNLGLPQWTVTLVIVLAGLGLVVTVALAWIFDITPEGIRRTGPAALSTPLSPHLPARRARSIAYAAIALVAVAGGWLALRAARGAADELDATRIAILPFRISAAGSDLAHLREGLPDLLVAALSSDSAPSAVPTRTVLAALDRSGGRDRDPTEDDARALARELDAGFVLVGEIVQRTADLAVTATLRDVRTGGVRATLRVDTPADSLHRLVDRLTNQLVAALGGTPQHRLAAITSTSRAAIEEYLKGMEDFRKGRYDVAAAHFDRAVEIDSTFALAALWLRNAAAWTGEDPPNAPRANRLAATFKHQLGDEDRLYLEALLGPNYPAVLPTHAELIALRERALRLHPQRAELWYLAGDWLMHTGALTGREDPLQLAAEYFDEAIRIDSTYVEPLDHAATLALARGDQAAFLRYFDLLMVVDSTSETMWTQRWNRHVAVDGHGPSAEEVIEATQPSQANELYWQALATGSGIAELADLVEQNQEVRRTHPFEGWLLGFHEGRPSRVAMFEAEFPGAGPTFHAVATLYKAVYWLPDPEAGASAARLLASLPRPDAGQRCQLALWYARAGQPASAARDTLASDSLQPPAAQRDLALCRQVVRIIALQDGLETDSARARLAAFDAMLRSGPRASSHLVEIANVEAARLWELAGEPERALAALRRRAVQGYAEWLIAERLAEEGRLAELTGDRDAAIRAYQRHLQLRSRPEGPFVETTERVRARLAALTAEPRE